EVGLQLAKAEAALAQLDGTPPRLVELNGVRQVDPSFRPEPGDPTRAKLEETVRKLTDEFQKAEAGYKQKVVPELEYLQAKLKLLRAQCEAQMLGSPADQREADKRKESLTLIMLLADEVMKKLTEGYRAGAVSVLEVRRGRVAAAVMKAELNDLAGKYD